MKQLAKVIVCLSSLCSTILSSPVDEESKKMKIQFAVYRSLLEENELGDDERNPVFDALIALEKSDGGVWFDRPLSRAL